MGRPSRQKGGGGGDGAGSAGRGYGGGAGAGGHGGGGGATKPKNTRADLDGDWRSTGPAPSSSAGGGRAGREESSRSGKKKTEEKAGGHDSGWTGDSWWSSGGDGGSWWSSGGGGRGDSAATQDRWSGSARQDWWEEGGDTGGGARRGGREETGGGGGGRTPTGGRQRQREREREKEREKDAGAGGGGAPEAGGEGGGGGGRRKRNRGKGRKGKGKGKGGDAGGPGEEDDEDEEDLDEDHAEVAPASQAQAGSAGPPRRLDGVDEDEESQPEIMRKKSTLSSDSEGDRRSRPRDSPVQRCQRDPSPSPDPHLRERPRPLPSPSPPQSSSSSSDGGGSDGAGAGAPAPTRRPGASPPRSPGLGAAPAEEAEGRQPSACQDVRYEQGAAPAPAAALPCQDIRYQMGCQDVRYQTQDVRYEARGLSGGSGGQQQQQEEQGAKKRNRGGRNRGGGGGGGGGGEKPAGAAGGGEGAGAGKAEKSEKKSRNRGGKRGGGGGGGGGGAAARGQDGQAEEEGGEGERGYAPHPLSFKIRKLCMQYEETLDIAELVAAYDALEASNEAGEGCCDGPSVHLLLYELTRISQLSKAHKVIDIASANKVCLDAPSIIHIACSVTQRSQSHKGLRLVRRLIYEMLPPDFGDDMTQFFDRHASFIFSELMAEADGCFGRMENRDSSTLVSLGHTELDVEMDWEKSSASMFLLHNRTDDKGKKVYIPTILQAGAGFQRTDCALMSYDISHPQVAAKLPRDYDRIRDGAEVEIISSSVGPNALAPLTVRLMAPPKVPFQPNMAYRLDRLASRDQTRRMMEALKTVLQRPGEGGSLQPAPLLRELVLVPADTTLSKVGKSELPLSNMEFPKHKLAGFECFQRDAKERYAHLLNTSQMDALQLACTRRMTLIQGPPGTGKTTTAVQIVSALVRYNLVELPLLVTADSNTAVDNLVKGIAKDGLQVVRVGRPESIREDVKQYSLDGRWKELKKAEVICATCIGVSGTTLEKVRFGTVLIDECTQAAEPASLVPLARGAQQAILIGDQCQLPPTVLSDVCELEGLGESMFTRLVTQGVRPVLLDTQYRMHPLICEFASAAFYNGRLQNGVSHLARRPPEGFPWPQRQMPVAFVNLERSEEKREGSSYINPAEAEKALWALQEVAKNSTLKPEDIGMVTPYKGQVLFIKKLIRERPSLQAFRSGLEIESVDGFQGQEKEVIIFCAVRNNREGKVGFLSDWRRLNVMLTRARRGCIVIGSRSTLVSDPLWKEWLLWASARGAICGEGAKGTWVPRYLVDDRDGMWTVKAELTAGGAAPEVKGMAAFGTGSLSTSKADEPQAVADSWEDLDEPESPKA